MVRKRPRVEHTEDWQEFLPLFWWPEQREYERIRQPVLFGTSTAERAEEGYDRDTPENRPEGLEDIDMDYSAEH